jgi:hypothetical protein
VDDIAEEVLRHEYIYVPWEDEVDTVEAGKELALYVARKHCGRLTVVCPVKSNATHHDELAKLPIVTERSGAVVDGGVVLAWCPSHKVMEKVRHLRKSVGCNDLPELAAGRLRADPAGGPRQPLPRCCTGSTRPQTSWPGWPSVTGTPTTPRPELNKPQPGAFRGTGILLLIALVPIRPRGHTRPSTASNDTDACALA